MAMNRALQIINLALFLLGAVTLVIVVNFFARQDQWRERIDATKTRAYSLSEQTRQLLAGLEGDWKIAIVLKQQNTPRNMQRQVDEVLSRYTSASPHISVLRIDPADPHSLLDYDRLVADLHAVYAGAIAEYDRTLDAGVAAFGELQAFAQQQAGQLEPLIARLPEDPMRQELQQRIGVIALLAEQGNLVTDAVAQARRAGEGRPLPDYETARSVLAEALSQWAGELDDLAGLFPRLVDRPNTDIVVRQFAATVKQQYPPLVQRLANAADPLKRLPPLELSAIGTQLQQGEAAVVISPKRAAIIPSSQLFPKSNLKKNDDGGVTFDQRFRGEQLISAAIRSLTVEHMPLVVFVHAEEQSLLQPRDKRADLTGVVQMLKASRFEVAEWIPGKQTDRPAAAKGQPAVWVVVPPPPARSMEPPPAARALIDAASKLITDGESVLLSVSPSLLAKYGQTDPYAAMAAVFGIEARTSELVFESAQAAAGESQVTIAQSIRDFTSDHLIGRAVDGQQTYFGMPVPLGLRETAAGVERHVIAQVQPTPSRWIENDWTGSMADPQPSPEQQLKAPLPMVIAAERASPAGHGRQRFLIAGSGGWMVSNVADVVLDVGGGRVALINPGNHELMLASAAWLAGMDDLVAASPVSQEIARLRGISPETRTRWVWIAVAGLPAVCVLLGVCVWMIRRN